MQKEIKELIKKIAAKENKPPQVIEEIFMSQFLFLKKEISTNKAEEIKTIMLPKWGKYLVSKKKLAWINYHVNNGKGKETNNQSDSKDCDNSATGRESNQQDNT